jgi:hypothetical protein
MPASARSMAALVRQLDPLLGRTLAARYRLVRRLGAGRMAVVTSLAT